MKIKKSLVFLVLVVYVFCCVGCGTNFFDVVDVTSLFDVTQVDDTTLPDEGTGVVFFVLEDKSMYDIFVESGTAMEFCDWLNTDFAQSCQRQLNEKVDKLCGELKVAGVSVRETFTTLTVSVSAEIDYADSNILKATTKTEIVPCESYAIEETSTDSYDDVLAQAQKVYTENNRGIVNNETEYQGEGMLVAVLDTGMRLGHSAFSTAPPSPKISKSTVISRWSNTSASKLNSSIQGASVYKSEKIPYAYDYANSDADVTTSHYHGMHVAGIIGGSSTAIQGVAPQCQLAIMKVFNNYGYASSTTFEIILKALTDCMVLGVDVVNMSLGATGGLSKGYGVASAYSNEVYQKLYEAGIIVCVSAGNDTNAAYHSLLGETSAKYVDNSLLSNSGSYLQNYCVGSANAYTSPYVSLDGKNKIGVQLPVDSRGDDIFSIRTLLNGQIAKSFNYVKIGGYGVESAYESIDVEGKVVVVDGGGTDASGNRISYINKISTAADFGAIGCIILDADYHEEGFYLATMSIPAFLVDKVDADFFNQDGTITFDVEYVVYTMSDFSSWGCGENLYIKPEIVSYGGEVYSATLTGYDYASGTSMSSPNVAGIVTVVKQYLKSQEAYQTYTAFEFAELVKAKIGSSAIPVEATNGNYSSIRQQGAGMADIEQTVLDQAYLTSTLANECKLELGDDKIKSGKYTLSALLHGQGAAVEYDISAIVMSPRISNDNLIMTAEMINLDHSSVIWVDGIETHKVVTSADSTKVNSIRVSISLSDEAKEYLDRYPNGIYVEGFLILTTQDGNSINIPWLAFYGDWAEVPSFDMSAVDGTDAYIGSFAVTGNVREYGKTSLSEYYLGDYPYDAEESMNTNFCALSTKTTGMTTLTTISVPLLRSAPRLTVYATTKSGCLLTVNGSQHIREIQEVAKCYYDYNYGTYNMLEISISFDISKATYVDVDGMQKVLKDDDVICLIVSTELEYCNVSGANKISLDIFIDNSDPIFNEEAFKVRKENGRTYLDIEVKDNFYLMAFSLYSMSEANGQDVVGQLLGDAIPVEGFVVNQFNKISLDITDNLSGYDGEAISIMALDYARNYTAYKIIINN